MDESLNVTVLLEKAEKKLAGVEPSIAEKARQLVKKAHQENIFIIITQGVRTIKEQNDLYAQGRTKLGKVVTNARGGYSYHNFALAFDFCVCDVVGGKLVPNWTVDIRWKRVGAIGKTLGLEWGGDWTSFKDYPHFQNTFGLSLSQLRNGVKPTVVKPSSSKKKYYLATGTFRDKEEAEQAAEKVRKAYRWNIEVKEL